MTKFKLSVCAGQGFKIKPIVRLYVKEERHQLPKKQDW
tara:strand:- start:453 stop:566 length:114 start_codon:yes stop_codon:yes gene_type:complete